MTAPTPFTAADAETLSLHPPAMPVEVGWAVKLLWLCLGVSVVQYLLYLPGAFDALPSAEGDGRGASMVGLLVPVAWMVFTGYLILCIARGRNWARVISLVLAIASLALQVAISPSPTGLQDAGALISPALTFAAMFLLFFTSGRRWFRRESSTNHV